MLGGIPWKVRFDMDFCILADLGGLAGLLSPSGAASCRPSLLKARQAKTGAQKSRFWVFLQLASKPSALEPHRDSVHGGGVGLKSYCTDAGNWHLHLAMFLTRKQCVAETEQMSAVEMNAVGPRPAAVGPRSD